MLPDDLSRRRFLGRSGAAALILAAHAQFGCSLTQPIPSTAKRSADPARIRRLRLRTTAPLAAMKAFYHGQLGLEVLHETNSELTIAGGATPITFVSAPAEVGAPFYHFAFNIPENKVRGAHVWQKQRSELLPIFPEQRDPDYPDEVIHFRNWEAHSVFFLDPAENIVEYIGRHRLNNAAEGEFTTKDILYASEIAFIADDVLTVGGGIETAFELPRFGNPSENFMALGDDHGLLLVFKRGRNLSLAREVPKHVDVFEVAAEIRAAAQARHQVPGLPYEIVAKT